MNSNKQTNLEELKQRLGTNAWTRVIDFPFERKRFFFRTRDLILNDRMGEVVFAVERPNGRFICVRSKDYPKGVFRIPTGGVGHGEDILGAVKREVSEELGLVTQVERFIGVNDTRLTYKDETISFYSFFFHMKEAGGRLLEDATDQEVSEVLETGSEELYKLSENLLNLQKEWRDWGKFRYLTTHVVADYVNRLEKERNF